MTTVALREISSANRGAVLQLRVSPEQVRFVGGVGEALADAEEFPEANPWYRAIYAGDTPVGFVMISWDVTPAPPSIIGPWFLWKLLIDSRYQKRGYGRAAVDEIASIVRGEGATELLTSYVEGDGDPGGFYERLGFTPTGERDANNEVILALQL